MVALQALIQRGFLGFLGDVRRGLETTDGSGEDDLSAAINKPLLYGCFVVLSWDYSRSRLRNFSNQLFTMRIRAGGVSPMVSTVTKRCPSSETS